MSIQPVGYPNDYRARVYQAAERRGGEPFFNTSLDHATIIVERMFFDAFKQVDILSGNLTPQVYGRIDVLRQADRFLGEPDRTLRILLEDDRGFRAENPFFEHFGHCKNVNVRTVPKKVQGQYSFHLLVTDTNSFRVEPDKTKPDAIVAFGSARNAAHVRGLFNSIWELSERSQSSHVIAGLASPVD